jgi:hypothetical protein
MKLKKWSKLKKLMKIVVNCKIVEEVLGPFLGGILVPFLGSIFAPFLVNSQSRICLFYGTFSMSKVVFGPFLDVFWTVLSGVGFAHFGTLLCPAWDLASDRLDLY